MGLRTGYGTEGRSPFPMPSMLADPTPLRARQQTKPPFLSEDLALSAGPSLKGGKVSLPSSKGLLYRVPLRILFRFTILSDQAGKVVLKKDHWA
ncbi:hypothetical protein FRX31_032852 [Thalictrum thalictroides]|uniref:Uncharacterized protein n=1 Tax=Thalictrum thalictroides TaxID=46969 RepID=A0A7J6UZD7_THATH|nr:hypothetical protein FRX31_032852 [Thalictrum thalictroides]